MKNRDIVKKLNEFQNLKTREKESGIAKFPVKVGFVIQKNIKILEKAYEPYVTSLKELQERYNIQENTLPEDYPSNFCKDIEELLEIDNEDVNLEVISLKDLERCQNLTLEDQDALFFMIKD